MIDQFKILRETLDHVTDMYGNVMERAERAEAESLQQAIVNGKNKEREANLQDKIELLERELAKVCYTKELNLINESYTIENTQPYGDSYEHELLTFSKRPLSNDRYNVVEER